MSENIYPGFHIEMLKILVTGWTINRLKIEKICLFRGCDDGGEGKGFEYWLVIVAPMNLKGGFRA